MSQLSPEEAEILLQENRFLKQTILALRVELVKKDQHDDSSHQKSLMVLTKENSALKETLGQLRAELEENLANSQSELQKSNQIHLIFVLRIILIKDLL